MDFQRTHSEFRKLMVTPSSLQDFGVICSHCFRSYQLPRDLKDHQQKCCQKKKAKLAPNL